MENTFGSEAFLCLCVVGCFLSLFCTLLEKSADRKAYLLGLLIDIGDLDINGIADLENIVRLLDLVICDLAYVNKSVNAGNDLRKSAEGHKAYDLDVRGIADLILVVENEPRIGILGLVSERDSALLAVESTLRTP